MTPFPVILSAPSGGGKTRIASELRRRRDDVGYSVSCTTRPPREGEVNGRDYHFVSAEEFRARREGGEFAEWAEVHGKLYGTLRDEVERVLREGRHVMMDIDVQGARQFMRSYPDSVAVFILPPSASVLLERLASRKTEDRASLLLRLRSARAELRAVDMYDYVVVNDELDRAVASVSAVIDAEALRRRRVAGLEGQVSRLIAELEREMDKHSTT